MSEQHGPDQFEQTDWDVKPVVITVLALFGLLILGIVMAAVTTHLIGMGLAPRDANAVLFHDTKALPPAPRLQVDEAADLKELRDREDDLLSSYAWVDPAHTAVRIPIDRAIDLVAAEYAGNRR